MHTEIRLLWEVSLADNRIRCICTLMSHYLWTPRMIFLSDFILSILFSFVVSKNWSWSTFSRKKIMFLQPLTLEDSLQKDDDDHYDNNNNNKIPLSFRDNFYSGNTLPHKRSYHVQMWRDVVFRRENLLPISSFQLN